MFNLGKEFAMLGKTINVTEIQLRYYKLRSLFSDLAVDSSSVFKQFYLEQTHSLTDFLEKGMDFAEQLYLSVCEIAVKYLTTYDIYQFEENDFQGYMMKNSSFIKKYEDLAEFNEGLIQDQEEQRRYREARKRARSRMYGGGFGLGNALVGAAKAGAVNMVWGGVHSARNLIGNTGTAISVSEARKKIYNNAQTKSDLYNAIYDDVYNLHYIIAQVIKENSDVRISIISRQDEKQAETLLHNIQRMDLSEQKEKDLLVQALGLNPFFGKLYQYIFNKYSEDSENCFAFAEYCYASKVFEFLKAELKSYYATLAVDTEENALKSKQLLLDRMALWHMSSSSELEDINAKLKAFDLAARTYEGVEYPTREERNKVASDVKNFTDQLTALGGISYANIEGLNQIKKAVNTGEYAAQTREIILNKIDVMVKARLKEIKKALSKNPSLSDLQNYHNEVQLMDIDEVLKNKHLSRIDPMLNRSQKQSELEIFKQEFVGCLPYDPIVNEHLIDLATRSCPLISEQLILILNVFTVDNAQAIYDFNQPVEYKKVKFNLAWFIVCLVAFICMFVFWGIGTVLFGILFLFSIRKAFSKTIYLSQKDYNMLQLISQISYDGNLIHPLLQKWFDNHDYKKLKKTLSKAKILEASDTSVNNTEPSKVEMNKTDAESNKI